MKNSQQIMILLISTLFILPSFSIAQTQQIDIDPLIDLSLTVDISKIRSLEHDDPQLNFKEIIDEESDPDFYVVVRVNGKSFTSDIFWNTRYLYDTPFSVTIDVDDTEEFIPISIQLWDAADESITKDRLCDISPDEGMNDDAYDVELTYNLKTGKWTGDDYVGDSSGYGRLNGCADGTIYERDRDCELWFDITQNDADGDGIPYYLETEVYGTDPMVSDAHLDLDDDGIPTWWEWKYDYDPLVWQNHSELDPDEDGITNYYEYQTAQWFSDPFTQDLFLELDQMEEGPNGEQSIFPEMAKEMLYTVHDRQNLVYHLDDGDGIWETDSGSEFVPFDELTDFYELQEIYKNYFLHNDEDNWRKNVFHYGVLIWESDRVAGMAFGYDRFQISAHLLDLKVEEHGFDRDVTYASAYMHETGHNLRFWPIPGHGNTGWLLRMFLPLYKSCMSYGWIYRMVDYSDGSRPHLSPFIGDYDDWERMDLTYSLNH